MAKLTLAQFSGLLFRACDDHLSKLRQQKQGLMHDLLTGRARIAIPKDTQHD